VHDPNAQQILFHAVVDKIRQSRPGLGNRHSMQVDFRLNGVFSAREFAHCPCTDVRTMKAHVLGIRTFNRVDIVLQAFPECFLLVGPCESRLGSRFLLWFWHAVARLQRIGAGNRTSEQVIIVIAQGGVLRLWCNDSFEYSERVSRRKSQRLHL